LPPGPPPSKKKAAAAKKNSGTERLGKKGSLGSISSKESDDAGSKFEDCEEDEKVETPSTRGGLLGWFFG